VNVIEELKNDKRKTPTKKISINPFRVQPSSPWLAQLRRTAVWWDSATLLSNRHSALLTIQPQSKAVVQQGDILGTFVGVKDLR
jgi:hypothetical protein